MVFSLCLKNVANKSGDLTVENDDDELCVQILAHMFHVCGMTCCSRPTFGEESYVAFIKCHLFHLFSKRKALRHLHSFSHH